MVEVSIPSDVDRLPRPREVDGLKWQEWLQRLQTTFIQRIHGRGGGVGSGPQSEEPQPSGGSQLIDGWGPREKSFLEGKGLRVELLNQLEAWFQQHPDLIPKNIPKEWMIASIVAQVQAMGICAWKDFPQVKPEQRQSYFALLIKTRGGILGNRNIHPSLAQSYRVLKAQEILLKPLYTPGNGELELTGEQRTFLDRLSSLLTGRIPQIRENEGKIWKEFLAYCRQRDMTYSLDISRSFPPRDSRSLADLLYATAHAYWEVKDEAEKAGQPMGYVMIGRNGKAQIKPSNDQWLLLYRYQRKADQSIAHDVDGMPIREAKTILLQRGTTDRPREPLAAFRRRVKETMEKEGSWERMDKPYEAMVAVNLDVEDSLFSPTLSQAGFEACEKRHPWLVYFWGKDANGKSRFQAAFNHTAADGILGGFFMQGGTTLINEGNPQGKSFLGVSGYYKLFSATDDEGNFHEGEVKELLDEERTPYGEFTTTENYGDVVVAHLPKVEGYVSAAVETYATLWVWQQYVRYMQEMVGEHWHLQNPHTAANFTVQNTENVFMPLATGACWTGDASMYEGSKYEEIGEVISAAMAFCGFKWETDKANYSLDEVTQDIPEAMKLMALVVHAKFPVPTKFLNDGLKVALLRANRSKAFTGPRTVLFVPTVPTERSKYVIVGDEKVEVMPPLHPTVAGRDGPNCVNRNTSRGIDQVYSVDRESEFVPPSQLDAYVRWAAPATHKLISIMQGWYGQETHDLIALHRDIHILAGELRQQLKHQFGSPKASV